MEDKGVFELYILWTLKGNKRRIKEDLGDVDGSVELSVKHKTPVSAGE